VLSRIAADLVLVVHLAFILFVVLGGMVVLHRPWIAWLHLPAALWGAVIELTGWVCPLTPLENRLRVASGSAGYDGGFIDSMLLPLVYPVGLDRDFQIILGLGVIVVNSFIYGVVVFRWLRRRRSAQDAGRER
jgi:hypothetical protein